MRILVIEDNDNIRLNIIEMLLLEDHEVLSAENGLDGLAIAKEQTLDLIFCDMMMPKMDGLEMLQQIRQDAHIATIPIIFITAKTEKANIQKGMEMGANGYLQKPFTISEILTALEPYQ